MALYKTKPQPLGEVLKALIQKMGIQDRMDKARVIETWADIAGVRINSVTQSVWLKEDVLFVQLNSAPWRHELHLRRHEWCMRLNQELGKAVVKEIIFK